MSAPTPLVTQSQLRDIALEVHDSVHGEVAEPLEVGQIMVALIKLQEVYEASMSEKVKAVDPDFVFYGFEPGTTVTIADGQITGFINAICMYAHGGNQYEVVYWSNGDRKSAWVNLRELQSDEPVKLIGFKAHI